ncbi:MAG: hypothetical protein JXR84_20670 [Anaerolineae bacterium]|nr:hypothetical protein [Anaerolineae bacterium]
MAEFTYTPLEEGEVVVIGPVTFSSSSSLSFNAGGTQSAQVSQTNRRKVGITNRRVIIERGGQPQGTQIISNADIKRVYVRREKFGTKIEQIETTGGQKVKLDIAGLSARDEARLFKLFPNAEIGQRKGLFGGFSKLTPRSVAASRKTRSSKPAARKTAPVAAKPTPPITGGRLAKSHLDDTDIQSLEDLRRYYPLPQEYDYAQRAKGDYVVKRLADGEEFLFLLEEGILGFDVPVQDPKRRKVTIEVLKKKQ